MFRYEEVPDPACGPGDVLIEVQAISIEGGDTLHRAGGVLASRPHIVGYQCAGVVREVGAGVTRPRRRAARRRRDAARLARRAGRGARR